MIDVRQLTTVCFHIHLQRTFTKQDGFFDAHIILLLGNGILNDFQYVLIYLLREDFVSPLERIDAVYHVDVQLIQIDEAVGQLQETVAIGLHHHLGTRLCHRVEQYPLTHFFHLFVRERRIAFTDDLRNQHLIDGFGIRIGRHRLLDKIFLQNMRFQVVQLFRHYHLGFLAR